MGRELSLYAGRLVGLVILGAALAGAIAGALLVWALL